MRVCFLIQTAGVPVRPPVPQNLDEHRVFSMLVEQEQQDKLVCFRAWSQRAPRR